MKVDVKYCTVDCLIYIYEQGTDNLITYMTPEEWERRKLNVTS